MADHRPIFQTLDRTARSPYPRNWYPARLAWNIVQATLFRIPLPKGYAWRRWLLGLFGARIGRPCALSRTMHVFHPWLLEVGDFSAFGPNVNLYNLGSLKIGSHTVLSQDVYVCGGTHDYTNPVLPLARTPIVIGSGVWVAAGAFVGPGVTIGDNTVVGARSVVIRDVPEAMVVAGNPARAIKPRVMRHAAGTAEEAPGE